MRILLVFVFSLISAPSFAGFCTPEMPDAACSQHLYDLTYDGWVVAQASKQFCPQLMSNDFQRLIDQAETHQPSLAARRRTVWREFIFHRDQACHAALRLYGPGGSMTGFMIGPTVYVRPRRGPPPPSSFSDGVQREQ